jgi:hypothetical protein
LEDPPEDEPLPPLPDVPPVEESPVPNELPEEPPLEDAPAELLLDEPPVDEPAPDPDEPPVPNELPDEDPLEDDLSVDELRPEEEAPLEDEPLPEASTPNALAVLSSSRPVACIPLSFWKARRACCVFGPMTPSAGPGSCPLFFSAS